MGFFKKLFVGLLIISFISWSLQIVMASSGKNSSSKGNNEEVDYDELPFQWVFGAKKNKDDKDEDEDEDENTNTKTKTKGQKKKKATKEKKKANKKESNKFEDSELHPDNLMKGVPPWVKKLAFGTTGKVSTIKEPKRSLTDIAIDYSN